MTGDPFDDLLDAMRRAAAVLRDRGIDFALAGGLAVYARGGPDTEHDVDFVLTPDDAERALDALAEAGWRVERPPEGWLYKAWDPNGAMVDLIFALNRTPIAGALLGRADELEVYAIELKVMTVTDVLAAKLLALKEHEADYDPVLEITRACREQIDWADLRRQTSGSPYAKAFFTLAAELGLSSQAA